MGESEGVRREERERVRVVCECGAIGGRREGGGGGGGGWGGGGGGWALLNSTPSS